MALVLRSQGVKNYQSVMLCLDCWRRGLRNCQRDDCIAGNRNSSFYFANFCQKIWHIELRERIVESWDHLDKSIIDSATSQWRTRLQACVKEKGGHIEHRLCDFCINLYRVTRYMIVWHHYCPMLLMHCTDSLIRLLFDRSPHLPDYSSIEIPQMDYPASLREQQYDAVVISTEKDQHIATAFQYILTKFITLEVCRMSHLLLSLIHIWRCRRRG